jgi:hypothetical protein
MYFRKAGFPINLEKSVFVPARLSRVAWFDEKF